VNSAQRQMKPCAHDDASERLPRGKEKRVHFGLDGRLHLEGYNRLRDAKKAMLKEVVRKKIKMMPGFKKPVASLLQLYEVSKNDPEATLASNAENMI
jgi:hypothetical protein